MASETLFQGENYQDAVNKFITQNEFRQGGESCFQTS